MAKSRFEYTRDFEQPDHILRNTWIVVRLDGRGFHRFSTSRGFEKPNDPRALRLMNRAAEGVLRDVNDVVLGYGQSDEYSFVFPPQSMLFERRASKLVSTVVSTFTAHYVLAWPAYFPDTPLVGPTAHEHGDGKLDAEVFAATGPLPTFDGRAVAYPSLQNLRDYLSWRQADCHINNLYNTTFWSLVQRGGMSGHDAEQRLAGTLAADKNEILFSQFQINYNNEPLMYRKGSVVYRDFKEEQGAERVEQQGKAPDPSSNKQREKEKKRRAKAHILVEHADIIEDTFWRERPWLLGT